MLTEVTRLISFAEGMSTQILTVAGIVALVTVIAYWRLFSKLDVPKINAVIPIWNEIRMTKAVCGFGMATLLTLLYLLSIGMVGLAYYRAMTLPSTENRMLLLASIGVSGLVGVLEGIVRVKLASGFGKGFFTRILMFIPVISTVLLWVLAFGKGTYMDQKLGLESLGISKDYYYARTGMFGQNYRVYPLPKFNPYFNITRPQDEYMYPESEPATVVHEEYIPQPEPELVYVPEPMPAPVQPSVKQEPEYIPQPVSVSVPKEQEPEPLVQEITFDQLDSGEISYDDLTLETRPQYPFEDKKPEKVANDDPMRTALEEALFEGNDKDLQEAVLNFVRVWKDDQAMKKRRVMDKVIPREKPAPEPSANDILDKIEKVRSKPKVKKAVDFNDDFWK